MVEYFVKLKDGNEFRTVKEKGDELNGAHFHGIGCFGSDKKDVLNTEEIMEVWIPWDNIEYVRNITYKYGNKSSFNFE